MREKGLPRRLRVFFWDYDFASLSWARDRHLVIARILEHGDWDAVRWLRLRLGDRELKAWLLRRQGRGLTPRQLRFWEVILDIPHRVVNSWLKRPGREIWDRRCHP